MHQEVGWTAVTGVLDLAHILELVVDRLDERSLAQQNLLLPIHELIGHVFPYMGDQFQATSIKFIEEVLADIAFVAKEFAPQIRRHCFDRRTVIDVAGREGEGQQFAAFVDDQVELEAEEPTHGGPADGSDAVEDAMAMGPFVGADFQWRRVDEADAGDVAAAVCHEIGKQRDRHVADALDKAVVAGELGEVGAMVVLQVEVEVFESAIVAGLEGDEDGDHFADGQLACPVAMAFATGDEMLVIGLLKVKPEVVNVNEKRGKIHRWPPCQCGCLITTTSAGGRFFLCLSKTQVVKKIYVLK